MGFNCYKIIFKTESHRKIKWVAKRVGEDKHIKNGATERTIGDKITTGHFPGNFRVMQCLAMRGRIFNFYKQDQYVYFNFYHAKFKIHSKSKCREL